MATYTRRINLYINGLQVQNNVKAIRAEVIKLERQINTMNIGSKEYVRTMRQLNMLKPILDQHNAQLKTTTINLTSLKGLANAFNKYMPMVMSFIGAISGMAFGTARASQEFAEFDDRIADVMKVTGMTREEVVALNEDLKNIDTRTAQDSLLELAWVAGKLGINAHDDILGFVNAADKITVALSKDLGGNAEEAIRAIGKAVEIFDLREVYGIEDAMIKVGSAINELGMASVAQEGFLVKFIERVAGIAPMAGVNIENVLGLAAALDMFGQKSEVSATAYSKLMTIMAMNTEEVSAIMGMSIREWTELFEKDANEAMLRLFETIGGEGTASFQQLVSLLGDADLDGQRMTQVMGTLVKNVDEIRKQQELATRAFAEGVSVVKEYDIKNTNAAATLEKKKKELKEIRKELGERLFPVYISGMGVLGKWLRSLTTFVEFIYEKRRAIITLISAIVAYQISLRTINAVTKTSIVVGTTFRAVQLQLIRGYALLTGNVMRAAAAQRLFNRLAIKNPYVAIAALVIAAATAIYVYTKRKREQIAQEQSFRGVMADTRAEIEKQTVELNALYEQLLKTNPESERRKDIIKRINEIHPDLLKGIDGEKASIEQLKGAYDEYIKSLEQSIELELLSEEIKQQRQKIRDLEKELETARPRKKIGIREEIMDALALMSQMKDEYQLKFNTREFGEQTAEILQEISKIEAALKVVDEGFMLASPRVEGMPEPEKGFFFDNEWISENDEVRIQQLRDRLLELNEAMKKVIETQENAEPTGNLTGRPGSGADYSDDAEEKALLALLQQYTRDKQAINQRMQEGITDTDKLYQGIRFRTEQEYNEARLKMQITYARGRLNAADRDGEKYFDYQKDLAEKVFQLAQEENKRLEELRKEGNKLSPFDEAQQNYIQKLINQGLYFDQEQELTRDQVKYIEAIHSQHLKDLDKLNADHFKEAFGDQDRAFEQRLSQLKFQHAQEFNEILTFEQAIAFLRGKISDEELRNLNTFYDAKQAILKYQEGQQSQMQLDFLTQGLKDIDRMIASIEFDFYDPLTPEAFLSDETKEAILERAKEFRDEMVKIITEITKPDDGSEETTQKLRRINLDIFGFTQDDWERFFNNLEKAKGDTETLKDVMLMAAMATANAWRDTNQIISNMEDRRLEEYRQHNQKRQEALEGNLKAGLVSQEFYDHQRQRLEEDLQRREAVYARKKAKRDKTVAAFEIILNTAIAVSKHLGNPIMAALIAAAGATQLAIVASTPLPQIPGAETGGQMMDVVREQDGKKFKARNEPGKRGYVSRPTLITGENGSEYIIPREGVENPNLRPLIEMIERARLNGSLPSLNPLATRSTRMPGRQEGGYATPQTTPATTTTAAIATLDDDVRELLAQNLLIMQAFSRQLRNPIRAEVALTGRKGLIEAETEYQQLMANANL